MFESIAILPNTVRKHPLNIGEMAEKMLYYKDVVVFANRDELITLFNFFDIDLLVEYLKRGYLRIVNRRKTYGAGFMGDSFLADFMFDKNYDLKKIIFDAYYEFSGDTEKSRKVSNQLYPHIGIFDTPAKFADEVNKDLTDETFVKQAIINNIQYYNPLDVVNPKDFRFDVAVQPDGRLKIDSSIDLVKYPYLDTPSILLNVGTAIEDIKIAANYNSELSVPQLNSKIISAKINTLISKASKSAEDIQVFQYTEFPDAPSLQQVINGRRKSMAEYLEVLKAGEKFKDWLTDLGEDNKLVKEYISKVNEKTWMQSAPSKAGRFYLVQGASTILKATGTLTGIAAGVVLSAANTFLAEKLFKGWRPNQFIDDEVIPFIQVQPNPGK